MKTQLLPLVAIAAASTVALPTKVHAADPNEPVALQVRVDVPPTWRPFLDDDISEAFASRVADSFRQRGFDGRIRTIAQRDEPVPELPLLQVQLTEWRIDRLGHARCTFSASLRSADGQRDLGIFTDSSLFSVSSGGRWHLSRVFDQANALEDAADNALRDLYRSVVKSRLLPGAKTR